MNGIALTGFEHGGMQIIALDIKNARPGPGTALQHKNLTLTA